MVKIPVNRAFIGWKGKFIRVYLSSKQGGTKKKAEAIKCWNKN